MTVTFPPVRHGGTGMLPRQAYMLLCCGDLADDLGDDLGEELGEELGDERHEPFEIALAFEAAERERARPHPVQRELLTACTPASDQQLLQQVLDGLRNL